MAAMVHPHPAIVIARPDEAADDDIGAKMIRA
jgi:hypothetical protein